MELSARLGWPVGVGTDVCARCAGPTDLTFLTREGAAIDAQALALGHRAPASVLIGLSRRYPNHTSPTLIQEKVRVVEGWARVKDGWRLAQSFAKSLASKALMDPISLPLLEQRHTSCNGTTLDGQITSAPCEYRQASKEKGRYYCGACGCGDRDIARLDTKLLYPYLECPKGAPGFSNHQATP